MTGRRLYVITAAMMLSLFLASIESTVVATAMPTIVAQLGGLSLYAWVFSAFMLASTTSIPIFGKQSDIYGRPALAPRARIGAAAAMAAEMSAETTVSPAE